MLLNTPTADGSATKTLHWAIVALFAVQLGSALTRLGEGQRGLGLSANDWYDWHNTLGQAALLLALARFRARRAGTLPAWADCLADFDKHPVHRGEHLLYPGMFLMARGGLLRVTAGGHGVLWNGVWSLPNPPPRMEWLGAVGACGDGAGAAGGAGGASVRGGAASAARAAAADAAVMGLEGPRSLPVQADERPFLPHPPFGFQPFAQQTLMPAAAFAFLIRGRLQTGGGSGHAARETGASRGMAAADAALDMGGEGVRRGAAGQCQKRAKHNGRAPAWKELIQQGGSYSNQGMQPYAVGGLACNHPSARPGFAVKALVMADPDKDISLRYEDGGASARREFSPTAVTFARHQTKRQATRGQSDGYGPGRAAGVDPPARHSATDGPFGHAQPQPVRQTLDRRITAIRAAGWVMFTEIDHAQAARAADMALGARDVLLFDSLRAGTGALRAKPATA